MSELESIKINPENQLLLEQSSLRLPYELSRRNLKTAQKHVEKEHQYVLSSLKTLVGAAIPGLTSTDKTLDQLDAMIARVAGLKRKLETLNEERSLLDRQAQARITHLNTLWEIPTVADVKYEEWSKVRLDRLLVDYMLRKGYLDSATALARGKGIEDLVDLELFGSVHRISVSLKARSLTEALAWCVEHKPLMKKSSSTLEFQLRFQQLIEMRRQGKLLEARNHASRYLAPHVDAHEESVRAASTLLVVPPDTQIERYAGYFSDDRWEFLADLFTTTHHELFNLPSSPLLHVALKAGLTALKTPSCHSVHASSASPSTNATTQGASLTATRLCPICSTELNELARGLPYAHHSQSLIESDPVVLPNSRIYGRNRLREIGDKMGVPRGRIRDPVTAEEFDEDELRKVFIM